MTSRTLARLNKVVVGATTGRRNPALSANPDCPPEGYRLVSRFLSTEETDRWRQSIESHAALFKPVSGKAGMSLPYHVLDGFNVAKHIPELRELAAHRLRRVAEETFGTRLELISDSKRAVRIQHYRSRHEGFKWHLDGALYSALLTLVNTNEGATEVLSPERSKLLFPVPYLLFPFPRLLESAGPKAVRSGPGDLLVIKGGEVLHRGVSENEHGQRLVFVASYNPVGTRPTPIWDWFARRLNY